MAEHFRSLGPHSLGVEALGKLVEETFNKRLQHSRDGLHDSSVSIKTGQLALQVPYYYSDLSAGWNSGTGTLSDGEETDYDTVGDFLGELKPRWEEFFASLPFKVYRSRIMTLQPRQCYSLHRDTNPRAHIALDDSEQCRFVFTGLGASVRIPKDGEVYYVDTRMEHTALNGGLSVRHSLVMVLAEPPKEYKSA